MAEPLQAQSCRDSADTMKRSVTYSRTSRTRKRTTEHLRYIRECTSLHLAEVNGKRENGYLLHRRFAGREVARLDPPHVDLGAIRTQAMATPEVVDTRLVCPIRARDGQ
jgi:hypothetical protein